MLNVCNIFHLFMILFAFNKSVVFLYTSDRIQWSIVIDRERNMNIVIAGGGKVGSELTGKLSAEGHEITLIDINADVLENIMEKYDVIAIQGNTASMDVLDEAGIRKADLLIAATNADEINLLACFTARSLNKNIHTIGRIRNPEYRRQAIEMRDLFGLNLIINPEQQAANEIGRLLKYPGFLNIDTFAKGNTEIVSIKVTESSPLKHVVLNKLGQLVHCQVLVCAVLRDGKCIMPDGNFVLEVGDLIYVTASSNSLNRLLKSLGIITHKVKQVLIAGGGRISYYLAQELEKTGIEPSIIESSKERCTELAEKLPNSTIISGDASSQGFLDSEGVENFDALVTLTGLDELNIVMSLYGNARKVPQIITKLSHAEYNRILDDLPVGSVVSPKELTCSTIVRYVRAMQNKQGAALTIHSIAKGQAEAIEFVVDKNTKYVGKPLKDIPTKENVLIVSISHGMFSEIATGGSIFNIDDTVVIVTNSESKIHELNDIFGE